MSYITTMSKISPSERSENMEVGVPKENASYFKFESALKPFIVWLKLSTGVDITRINKMGNISLFLYGICLLFFNFACTGIFNYVFLKQKFEVSADIAKNSSNTSNHRAASTTAHINMLTVLFVTGWEYVFICGIHLCFFALQNRFKKLWNTLMIIEKELKLGDFTRNFITKSLWIGSLIIPLHSAAFMLYFYFKTSESAMIPPVYLSLMIVTECYPATIIIMLWLLVRIASCLFSVLQRRMKQTIIKEKSSITLEDVISWKLHHGLIIILIKRINHCFGIINLLIMIRTFLTFIYNVYEFVGCLVDFSITPYFFIYKFILQASLPSYLIYSCSQLKEKSSKIANVLHGIDIYSRGGNLEIQNMENGLYLQVIQANPNITSGRLFNLDFHLFPTLIGTTLTYVVILVSAG